MTTAVSLVTMTPFFLTGSGGKLYAIYFSTGLEQSPDHAVLYFPPFAEEMNKSRRMAALQARRIAELGHGVLLVDLFGTGDSEGDFSEARWEIWQENMLGAVAWLEEQGIKSLTLWGLRLGSLLAMQLATVSSVKISRIILWQPVVKGSLFMNQFLRLRIAAGLMSTKDKITTSDLRTSLAQGEEVEIAGYQLSSELLYGVDEIELESLVSKRFPPIYWMELLPSPERPISMVTQNLIQRWQDRRVNVSLMAITGEAFWSTSEITLVPALLDKTTELISTGSV